MSPNHFETLSPLSFWYRLIVTTVLILSISRPVATTKDFYYAPNATHLRREFFVNNLSFITVASVWVFFLIIFIIFRLYYLDERSKLHQVFDDCSPSTTQYKYLIRLRIGKSSSIFQKDTSAIMIDLLDPRHCFITRLSVSPSWLKTDVYARQSSEKPRLRSLKFVLNRASPMPTIGAIRLAHDSYFPVGGYIFLHSLEVQNLTENILIQIPVFKRIFVLPPDANATDQVFHARLPSTSKKQDESSSSNTSGYAPYLTFSELLVFSFFYSNITLFSTLFSPTYIQISNFEQALYNGISGLVPSSLVTILLLFFYRFFVKIFYSKSKTGGAWSFTRVIFLSCLTLNGLVIGLAAAYIQSRQTSHTLTFWSLAILVANVSIALIIVPFLLIILIYQIFSTRANPQLMLAPSFTSKVVDEIKLGNGKRSSMLNSLLKYRDSIRSSKRESMIDEISKSKVIGKEGSQEIKSNKTDEEIEEGKLEKIIVKKRSMEEGLMEKLEPPPIQTARERILSRIQSVLGRSSKEHKSQGEERIYDIDKNIENRTHERPC